MLFNTIEFFIFLGIVYALYRCLPCRAQNRMLLAASYLFYGCWDLRFLFLIVISTAVDFCAGLLIDSGEINRRKRWLVSTYVLVSAFCFVTIEWNAVEILDNSLRIEWPNLLSSGMGWAVFAGTLVIVLIGNLLYPFLISLDRTQRRHIALFISVITNLGILGFFKYFNFFLFSAGDLLQLFGLSVDSLRLNIILPVGISFYTFQTMSYTIDIYRGKMQATDQFLDFALFVSYFPQLVAGPIERAVHLLPSLLEPRKRNFKQTAHGLHLILIGLFKKVAIADGVAQTVDQVYGSTGVVTGTDVVIATCLFAIQIYCDFSGYSDIARGVSNLLGIDLVVNFRTPYFSSSPQEFWRRWHISLSNWLRDYLYIPLGGSRQSPIKTYRNLMMTMTLGGLWHGAAWNFVLWGIYQGAILGGYRVWVSWRGKQRNNFEFSNFIPIGQATSIIFCLIFVLYGWLLFRAQSLSQIVDFTGKILTIHSVDFGADIPRFSAIVGIPVLVVLDTLEYSHKNDENYYHYLPRFMRGALYALMTFSLVLGVTNPPAEFIYFDF